METARQNYRKASVGSTIAYVLCAGSGLADGFDLGSTGMMAPQLTAAFGAEPSQLGIMFGLTALGLTLGSVAGGWCADRFGPRRSLVGALAIFGLFSLLSPLSPNLITLSMLRMLTGLGMGAALPNIIMLVSAFTSREARAQRVTLISATIPLGGALVGGLFLVTGGISWRVLLAIGGTTPLIFALLVLAVMPQPPLNSVSSAVAEQEIGVLKIVELFRRGLTLTTIGLWLSFFVTMGSNYVMLSWLPTFFHARGLPPAEIGVVLFCYSVGGGMGVLILGAAMSPRRFIYVSMIAYIGAIISLLLLARGSAQIVTICVIMSAAGFFLTGALQSLYGVVPMFYPPEVRGTSIGSAISMGRFGSGIGPMVVGALLGVGVTSQEVLLGVLPFLACVLVCVVTLLLRLPTPYTSRTPAKIDAVAEQE